MESTHLLTLDYIVIAIIALSTLFAFVRGFIGSLFSLAGWILSIYLSYHFYPDLKPYIEPKIKNQIGLLIGGHSILLMGFLIFFGIFNLLATRAVKGMTNGIIDRILGAGFGILRGAIIVSFFFFIFMSTLSIFHGSDKKTVENEDQIAPKWLKDSMSYSYLKDGRDILKDFIPDTFNQRIQVAIDDLSKKTNDERFVETAFQKLDKTLTKDQKEKLSKEFAEDSTNMTIEEAEQKKLRELLDLYRDNLSNGKVKDEGVISNSEVKRIENILNNKSLKPSTEEVEISEEAHTE